ncbi:MAG: exosortase/archaeosortase family protein [Nitrospira sp.]|nr:exosortase/archaeosortase family protein [Nitrospira sp.]
MQDSFSSLLKQPGILGRIGILAGTFLFCYWEVVSALVNQWIANDVYSYAFLIPVISCYMIWLQRERLSALFLAGAPVLGWFVLSSGLAALLMGWAGHLLLVQELSLLLTLSGLVLLFWGVQAFRLLRVPIGYLLFMIPVWGFITDPIQMPARLFSAKVAAAMLQGMGLTLYLHDIYIELPNITLVVAPECSGVNYLFAVAAIGVPIAFFYLKGWKHRLTLLVSALAIAMVANGLRIALIGIVANFQLSTDSHGPLHILQGLFVSVVGYAGIFAVLWLLRRRECLTSHSS